MSEPKKLSGSVSVLLDSATIYENRELGPDPIEVRDNVLPREDLYEPLDANQEYGAPIEDITPTLVTRTFPAQDMPLEPPSEQEQLDDHEVRITDLEIRVAALEAGTKSGGLR